MSKWNYIDWPRTVELYHYADKKLKPKDLVIVHCSICNVEISIQYRAIRKRKPEQPYSPICNSCQVKRQWQNEEYRSNQSIKQSKAMKAVWQDPNYRASISEKISINTKRMWENPEFADKISKAISKKYADDPGYKEKHIAALQTAKSAESRVAAINEAYKDPEYHNKLSAASKATWQQEGYRAAMLAKRQSEEYRAECSEKAKSLWTNKDYGAKIRAYLASAQVRVRKSIQMKQLWQNHEYRRRMHATSNTPEAKAKRSRVARLACNTPRYKKLMSEISSKNWTKPKYRQHLMALYATPGYKVRASAIGKKLWVDPEFRLLMMGKLTSPEHRKKLQDIWKDPEYRQRMLALYATPEYKAKASAASKMAWMKPGYRSKMAESSRRLWENPEFAKKCLNGKSKQEEILAQALNSIGIQHTRQYHLGRWLFDFMIPHSPKNIVIEVQGDYHHSRPDRMVQDAAKATFLSEYYGQDHELHTIWEHEFLTPGKPLELVKKWLGLSSDVKLQLIDFKFADVVCETWNAKECNELFSKFHYMASGGRGGFNYAARLGGKVIACARLCGPTRSESATRLGLKQFELLELTRFVIDPQFQIKNFASWFLSRCVRIVRKSIGRAKCLISFADSSYGHSGIIYKAAGWTLDGVANPDYHYVSSDGWRVHKRTLWSHSSKMKMSESAYAEKYGFTKVFGGSKNRYIRWL